MSSTLSANSPLQPQEVVFSCAICQATITELYRRPRSDQGFSSGNGDEERVITRLWLTECGHLTCNDHLDGGGVPFHPKGERPSAPCPFCMAEKGDRTPKVLFGIIGPAPGDHDKDIPEDYFLVPPPKLNGTSNATGALRFQYLSMLRFSSMMYMRYKELNHISASARARANDVATSLNEARSEAVQMRARIKKLEEIEAQHLKYKKREPEIRHYLGNVSALANENNMLKTELRALGYEVPRTTYAYGAKDVQNTDNNSRDELVHDDHRPERRDQHISSSSSRKRNRTDYEGTREDLPAAQAPTATMAPPPRPYRSTERVNTREPIPQRVSLASGFERRPNKIEAGPAVEMFSDGHWRAARPSDEQRSILHPETAYMMSGALPSRQEVHHISRADPRSREYEQYRPPVEPYREPAFDFTPAKSVFRQTMVQDDATHLNDAARYAMESAEQRQNFRATSPSSLMRQPLILSVSRGNLRQTDSGYQSHTDGYAIGNAEVMPARISKVMNSPFFHKDRHASEHMHAPMKTRSAQLPKSERLVSGYGDLRMEPANASPQAAQNLNALSFINEPYTRSNRPVFNRPVSRTSLSRAAPHSETGGFTSRNDLHREYAHDSQRAPGRLTSAVPSMMLPIRQAFNKNEDLRLGSVRGMKGIPQAGPTYSRPGATGWPTSRPPPQPPQQRGFFPAGGRRSVRR